VAFDANGGAFVADNNLHRVVALDRHLRRVRTWGTQGHGHGKFVFPRALAIQPNGHVLVADAGNDRVQEFTRTGGFVRSIGINGRARPHLTAPADVAANVFGEVAVADGNGRISWLLVCSLSSIAGPRRPASTWGRRAPRGWWRAPASSPASRTPRKPSRPGLAPARSPAAARPQSPS
jgi:hypothetical protein